MQLQYSPWYHFQQANERETRVTSGWYVEHVFIGIRDPEILHEDLAIRVVLDKGEVVCVSSTPLDLVET